MSIILALDDATVEASANSYLDEVSKLLFGKLECNLTLQEKAAVSQYIYDYGHPVWKEVLINGSKTGYTVSNMGAVLDPDKCPVKVYKGANGYHTIWLRNIKVNGVMQSRAASIHRLVAIAFIPNPENKKEVNHKNGNKTLNWVGNLEWATRQENADHAVANGLMRSAENNQTAKLTNAQVHEICKLAEQKIPHKEISERLGVSDAAVIGILYRGEWQSISKQYHLPEHKPQADEALVREICRRLAAGEGITAVSRGANVSYNFVDSIHKGRAWRRISNEYDIPGLEKKEVRDKKSVKIDRLLEQGISDVDEIIRALGLPDTRPTRKYVMKRRYKYRQKKS